MKRIDNKMDLNKAKETIDKISPMYPDLREVLNFIVGGLENNGLSKDSVDKSFKKELIDIKGIGERGADNITSVFPNKEGLVRWIKSGKELPFDKNIDKLLIETFKN